MSCRDTAYSSAMFTLAREGCPLEEKHCQEEYHLLRRRVADGLIDTPQPPSADELATELDRYSLWVRHSPTLPTGQRRSLLDRLAAARNDPPPDATTWYATRSLSRRLTSMTDPGFLSGRIHEVEQLGEQATSLVESARTRLSRSERLRGRVPDSERLSLKEAAEADLERTRGGVRAASACLARAHHMLTGDPSPAPAGTGSDLLDCDTLIDQAHDLDETISERMADLYRSYDRRDPEALTRAYLVNRHVLAAQAALTQALAKGPQ